ncbi:hypothetical protein ACP275_11G022300 [Erythranthe tilingii]
MGGATRFMTLLTAPFPTLRPSLIIIHRRFSSIATTPFRLLTLYPPSKTKTRTRLLGKSFHSQPSNNAFTLPASAAQQQNHHPWPEWNNFLDLLSNGQGFASPENLGIPPEDAFVVYEELTDDFVAAASTSIAFARARPDLIRSLSRRNIEAVVSNGTPFLFKSALDTARRMRAFLGTDGSNVSDFDKANTVDLMKYILSYASNPTVSPERNGLYSRELVDSSVRSLLHELVAVCRGVQIGKMPASGHQFSGQAQRPFGQNIEMKRGDWICSKCNFMNFAKNTKCLECEETRPKKQLSGGEWECPACTFFNYGRNAVCLRCDCRKPGAPLLNNTNNSQLGSVYNGDHSYKTNQNNVPIVGENFQFPKDSTSPIGTQNKEGGPQGEKSERWFKKIAELHDVNDSPSAVPDKDFPEIMPMRKGENRFVVNKNKDRSLTSPKYKRQESMDQANSSNFVPFVPFPPNYFSKNETVNDEKTTPRVSDNDDVAVSESGGGSSELSGNRWTGKSLEGSAVKEANPLDMSEEAKAERWFKRVAQIKDISELSQIPDEDFPSIMPMRKGVNRFVVSKRKTPLERRLTSQQYRRNLPVVSSDSVKKESDDS